MKAIRSGDPIAATAWLEDVPDVEGDDVTIHAELTDVDEVTVVVDLAVGYEEDQTATIHLSRVQAIALAGQLAWAATASPAELPSGHGPQGPLT